ncbi:MAG: hypothetical protein DPW09_23390 [Anaerolineae bacterium]|nr:hypothetical protein [Anaerolineales bacterium]MCQ3976385.1 hypothetical protein [Anaerolineae bacterium]
MAKQKHAQQSWWQLGAVVLIMVGLLILAHQVAPSSGWRIFLEMGVVVAGYGLIILWLDAHSTALLDRESAGIDSHAIDLLEERSAQPSPHVQVHFYVYSDSAMRAFGNSRATFTTDALWHSARLIGLKPGSPGAVE